MSPWSRVVFALGCLAAACFLFWLQMRTAT